MPMPPYVGKDYNYQISFTSDIFFHICFMWVLNTVHQETTSFSGMQSILNTHMKLSHPLTEQKREGVKEGWPCCLLNVRFLYKPVSSNSILAILQKYWFIVSKVKYHV